MNRLSTRNRMLVGLTLFSMFFGAGNLIFPPYLGAMAGTKTPLAMLGFAITAIGFPILGVIAVAHAGSLDELAGRVHPVFAKVFTLLIYLSIGPCLAIPRTASTSFEMAVTPFLSGDTSKTMIQLIYSILFFAVAFYVSLSPEKLTHLLGRFTSPCLLILIGVMFVGCLLAPPAGYGESYGLYAQSPVLQGFLGGYQTMDAIAALNFGIIIAMNINNRGVTERSAVVKEITYAGWIAGLIFLVVYGAIAHVGAVAGGAYGELADGTAALTAITRDLFGNAGIVLLGLIFLLACLNTCIGLISCCSEYFSQILPRFSQRQWAFFFAFVSMVISNAGPQRHSGGFGSGAGHDLPACPGPDPAELLGRRPETEAGLPAGNRLYQRHQHHCGTGNRRLYDHPRTDFLPDGFHSCHCTGAALGRPCPGGNPVGLVPLPGSHR